MKRVKRLDLETDKLSLNMESEVKSQTLQIPAKLYRIGELVSYTPFSRQTIHNYTIMGLICEVQWTEGGHRLYDESVFERLSKIIELKKTKTLWEIRQILNKEEAASKAESYCSRTENNLKTTSW
ncbi:unnamed protein product, partial [marine sediment metagenome]